MKGSDEAAGAAEDPWVLTRWNLDRLGGPLPVRTAVIAGVASGYLVTFAAGVPVEVGGNHDLLWAALRAVPIVVGSLLSASFPGMFPPVAGGAELARLSGQDRNLARGVISMPVATGLLLVPAGWPAAALLVGRGGWAFASADLAGCGVGVLVVAALCRGLLSGPYQGSARANGLIIAVLVAGGLDAAVAGGRVVGPLMFWLITTFVWAVRHGPVTLLVCGLAAAGLLWQAEQRFPWADRWAMWSDVLAGAAADNPRPASTLRRRSVRWPETGLIKAAVLRAAVPPDRLPITVGVVVAAIVAVFWAVFHYTFGPGSFRLAADLIVGPSAGFVALFGLWELAVTPSLAVSRGRSERLLSQLLMLRPMAAVLRGIYAAAWRRAWPYFVIAGGLIVAAAAAGLRNSPLWAAALVVPFAIVAVAASLESLIHLISDAATTPRRIIATVVRVALMPVTIWSLPSRIRRACDAADAEPGRLDARE